MFILYTPPISPSVPGSGATAFLVACSYPWTLLGGSSCVDATAISHDSGDPSPSPLAPACCSADVHDRIRKDNGCYSTPPSHRRLRHSHRCQEETDVGLC